MDTPTLLKSSDKTMEYRDQSYSDLISKLEAKFVESKKEVDTNNLLTFVGDYEPDKKLAVDEISKRLKQSVKSVDISHIITDHLKETYNNIDELFDKAKPHSELLYIERGEYFCGMFTGHTLSKVRYATPQERYFLRKLDSYDGLVIISVNDYDYMDEHLLRMADAVVEFDLPDSFFKRLAWKTKTYTFHGYRAY